MKRFFGDVWERTTSPWAVRIYGSLVLVMVVLAKTNLFPGTADPYLYLGIIMVGVWLAAEVMNERTKAIEATFHRQTVAMQEVSRSLSAGSRLYSLEECVADLDRRLVLVTGDGRVRIDHLGLDMSQAWEKVKRILGKRPLLGGLEYRLLVIAKAESELLPGDRLFREWFRDGSKAVRRIAAEAPALERPYAAVKSQMKLELRAYPIIPVVHGFRIVDPDPVLYVSMCRWSGEESDHYDWGGQEYQIIEGEGRTQAQRDLKRVFEGHFDHLWREGRSARTISAWG